MPIFIYNQVKGVNIPKEKNTKNNREYIVLIQINRKRHTRKGKPYTTAMKQSMVFKTEILAKSLPGRKWLIRSSRGG